jgi:LPXTG-site transpeptidase (sortase) family protein
LSKRELSLMRMARLLSLFLMLAGGALMAAAAAVLALYLVDRFHGDEGSLGLSDAGTVTAFDLRLERWRTSATPEPDLAAEATPAAEPTPVGEVPGRLVIPRIGVDAPIVKLSVDGNGVMESPSTPTDAGWYDFTARPGQGGNAVFSGHVDYHNYGAAVFWDLRNLEAGDVIEVYGEDGGVYRYKAVSSVSYPADEAPVDDIVGRTERETVTLITCVGQFNYDIHQYSHRLVVQAERVEEQEPSVSQ